MNPYSSIWFKPKQTFQNFFDSDAKTPLYFLPVLVVGISLAINMTPDMGSLFADEYSVWISVVLIPVGIGLSYLVFSVILPSITRAFGKIWGGQATMRQMANVYSLSLIPHLILLINQIALFAAGQDPTLDNVNAGVDTILRLWTIALLVFGVSRVQKFSYGIALLNVLITYVPFILIALMRQ